MKKLILNIYILFVIKWLKYPGSVSEEERTQNKNDAFKAACLFNDDIWSARAASYASDAAGDIAAVNNIAADICNYEKAQEWVNKYFELTGENKQDYFDDIKKEK